MVKKYKYLIGFFLLGLASYFFYHKINAWIEEKKHQEWLANAEHTASSNVQILENIINIDYLDEKRSLSIYLPQNYHNDTLDYPVIYFLDGQSLFDQKILEGPEWQIDEVIDSLNLLGQQQAIVIGIYSSEEDRLTEYKPISTDKVKDKKPISGDKHAQWIVTKLKSWVDSKYRTKQTPEATVIAGASLGGLMSYYMLNKYPDVFGRAIVFSPSFWVNDDVYKMHENNTQIKNQKIYFNAGALETPTVESIEKMRQTLLDYGLSDTNIKLDIEPDLGHWHATWRAGFKKVYPWIVK